MKFREVVLPRAKRALNFYYKAIIVLMLLLIDDEDLERLHRDYPNWEDKKRILLAMFLNPKEKWAELGVPEYLLEIRDGRLSLAKLS